MRLESQQRLNQTYSLRHIRCKRPASPHSCLHQSDSSVWCTYPRFSSAIRQVTAFNSGQRTFSEYPRFSYVLRILSLVVVAAVIFAIAGGLLGSHVAPKHGSAGLALRRMGACVFALSFLLIVFVHFGALTYRWHIRAHRRQVKILKLNCLQHC